MAAAKSGNEGVDGQNLHCFTWCSSRSVVPLVGLPCASRTRNHCVKSSWGALLAASQTSACDRQDSAHHPPHAKLPDAQQRIP
eukprot:9035259-Pyramimonas_sp.AAC.1